MISDLDQHLTRHLTEATAAVAAAVDLDGLRVLDAELLGKASVVTEARRGLGAMDAEQRKDAGRRLNEVRAALEHLLDERRSTLEAQVRAATLEAERLDHEVVHQLARGRVYLPRGEIGHSHGLQHVRILAEARARIARDDAVRSVGHVRDGDRAAEVHPKRVGHGKGRDHSLRPDSVEACAGELP